MKLNSFLKLKHMAWASGAFVVAVLVNVVARSGAKASVQPPSAPAVQVAAVEEGDVPVYGEWVGTLTGQVNADVKAQVTGYLLKRDYREQSTADAVSKTDRFHRLRPAGHRIGARLLVVRRRHA
jgi:multidrug efflux pump subunit AcrA (membrane-fusion protein)